jgi:hypothetical protein
LCSQASTLFGGAAIHAGFHDALVRAETRGWAFLSRSGHGETIRLAVSGLSGVPGKAVIAAAQGGAGIAFSLLFAGVHRGSTTPCVSFIA